MRKNIIYDDLKKEYVDEKKVDDKKMYYGTIKGMVNAIGDHATVFLDPKENEEYKKSLSAEYEGIGIMMDSIQGVPHVITVFDGSPAKEAGLRSGDLIIKVDGKEVVGETLLKVVKLIKGPSGTKVTLTVIHPDNSSKKVDLVVERRKISAPSMRIEEVRDKIAVVRVNRFTEKTPAEWLLKWSTIVKELQQKIQAGQVKGIVLDLRDNPGGFFDASIQLLSDFLAEGKTVAYQQSRIGIVKEFKTTHAPAIPLSVPMVILVNDGTASAAEITTGALQYYKRGYVIGEKTYGKGTVQRTQDYSDGSSLHITIYKWLLPNKKWINPDAPITPDKIIEFDVSKWEKDKQDNQLEAGIDYLKTKLGVK